MKLSHKFKQPLFWRGLIGLFAVGLVCFGIYLRILYGQLQQAFTAQAEFQPTRIYSDLTPLEPGLIRKKVDARLKALNYSTSFSSAPSTDAPPQFALSFNLHLREYPDVLLPPNHPQLSQDQANITLEFDQEGQTATLQKIKLSDQEVPSIYLEPELIATLSRSTSIRKVLKFRDIPAPVWKAIISIEDQHFLEHKGLDPRGLARAIWVNLKTLSLAQGGSTITQQLVKNLMARRTKNIFRKFNELFLALLLESTFDKEEILERYLNEVYLGQIGNIEIHGVAEGAEFFYGKNIEELNLAEIALMAGLIRGPAYYSPYRYRERALERQKLVLKKMVETGQIADEEALAALQLPIRLAPPKTATNKAPYFTDFVKAELIRVLKDRSTEEEITQMGLRIYTTLDPALNQIAQSSVSDGIQGLEKRIKLPEGQKLEGALATVDQSTGAIRALIGGRSYAQSTFNRILNMKRQVGSTFKPIVYLTALRKQFDTRGAPYGPAYPVLDQPWTLIYDRGKQRWEPRNYEKEFKGWIPLKTALAHSINTVAARLGYEVGIPNVIQTARALGIESDLPEVPSLSLGVSELSPVELLKAYATLANHGVLDTLTVIRAVPYLDGRCCFVHFQYDPKQRIETVHADWMTYFLRGVFTDGTAKSALSMGFDLPAAGKTGTTSQYRDAWFAGYTPHLTTVVWVGMDQDTIPTHGTLTGGGSALPIWVSFMKKALEGEPKSDFPQSPYLQTTAIDFHTGRRAASDCPEANIKLEPYPNEMPLGQVGCESDYLPMSSVTQSSD